MSNEERLAIVAMYSNGIEPVDINDLLSITVFSDMMPFLCSIEPMARLDVYTNIADAIQSTFNMRQIDIKTMDEWLRTLQQQNETNEHIHANYTAEWNKLSKKNKEIITKLEGTPVDMIQSLQMFGALYDSEEEATADANNRQEFLPVLRSKIAYHYQVHAERFSMTYTPDVWNETYRLALGWLHHQMSNAWRLIKAERYELTSQMSWDAARAKDCLDAAQECLDIMQTEFETYKGEYNTAVALPLSKSYDSRVRYRRLEGDAAASLVLDALERCLHTNCKNARNIVIHGVDMLLQCIDIKWQWCVMGDKLLWRAHDRNYYSCEEAIERCTKSFIDATQSIYQHKDDPKYLPYKQMFGIIEIGYLLKHHKLQQTKLAGCRSARNLAQNLPYYISIIEKTISVCDSFELKGCRKKLQTFKERMEMEANAVYVSPSQTYNRTKCPICGTIYECPVEYYFMTTKCEMCNEKMYILPGLSMWYDVIYSGVQYITENKDAILHRIANHEKEWWQTLGGDERTNEFDIMNDVVCELQENIEDLRNVCLYPCEYAKKMKDKYWPAIESGLKWDIAQWEDTRKTLNI